MTDTQDRTLSILVHGESKVGKTTLASTAPLPILALDVEGGWRFIPHRKIRWDPRSGPPPRYDGTWDVVVVVVRDWEVIRLVYQWLTQAEHDFHSLVVDSVTELQRRCKQNMIGTEEMRIQDWGTLLSQMDAVIRGFRDLTLHPTHPLACVVFIAETREMSGKWRPHMQGQINTAMPYWMDIVGYLHTTQALDANGQPTQTVRRLLITPTDEFVAGERVQGRLGGAVDSPNITTMMQQIYQTNHQPQGEM